MRILLYTFSFPPKVDGVVSRVLNTVKRLREEGHAVRIATPQWPVQVPGWLRDADVQVDHWPGMRVPVYRAQWVGNALDPRLWLKVKRSLDTFQPDLLHLIGPDPGHYAACVVASLSRVPILVSYHSDAAGFARSFRVPPRLVHWLESGYRWSWIDRVITTSEPFRRILIEQHHIPCHGVWPPGVDTDLFRPRTPDVALRGRLTNGHPDRFLFLFVGRFSPEKDIPFLLRILTDMPRATLALIGDGPDQSWRRRMPERFFVSSGFWSPPEVAHAYDCADAFITASCTETCGFSALEATASGLPVLAPAAQGLLSAVDDQKTGLLYCPGDLADARKKAELLVGDSELRARLRAGSIAARDSFGWAAATTWLVAQYQEIVAGRGARRAEHGGLKAES